MEQDQTGTKKASRKSSKVSNNTQKENPTMTETKTPETKKSAAPTLAELFPNVAKRCTRYNMSLKKEYSISQAVIILVETRCWVYRMCTEKNAEREHFAGAHLTEMTATSPAGETRTLDMWQIPAADLERRIKKQEDAKARRAYVEENPREALSRRHHRQTWEEVLASMSTEEKIALLQKLTALAAKK